MNVSVNGAKRYELVELITLSRLRERAINKSDGGPGNLSALSSKPVI